MLDFDDRPYLKGMFIALAGVVGIGAIGALDYASGTELRVYPFYWAPVALLAWHFGRPGAVTAAILAAGSWSYSNYLAGLRFSNDALWAANVTVQGVSFLLVGIIVSTLHGALSTARALSRADPLTGLRNSRAFYEDAQPLLALCRRSGQPITVAYIDLDNFKTANDRYGHQTGDSLLRDLAKAIRTTIRPSDIPARLGGDEFAIMLAGLGELEARTALERLRSAMNQTAENLGTDVTASIGAVTFKVPPSDLESLVQRADAVMYEAKAGGRNLLRLQVADDTAAPHQTVRARR